MELDYTIDLQVCYDLCCPHGYHYITNPEFDVYAVDENAYAFYCGAGSKANFSKIDLWNDGVKQVLTQFEITRYFYPFVQNS